MGFGRVPDESDRDQPRERGNRERAAGRRLGPGRLAQIACLLEVTARKPGNVHRFADLPGLELSDFLLSATAIAEPLDRAAVTGIGRAVYEAIEATRRVASTNTNLGMVLLLAPLAAVPDDIDLRDGLEAVLAATTVDDARSVYRAIRLAAPGGLGDVPEQDVKDEPTVTLREAMILASDRDMIACQYADGFRAVFDDALPAIRRVLNGLARFREGESAEGGCEPGPAAARIRRRRTAADRPSRITKPHSGAGGPLETAIISSYLNVLAHHPDSLIVRKHGLAAATEVSHRAAELLKAGWPDCEDALARCDEFDAWLRHPDRRFNPGTSADLVTAALFAGLREGTIQLPAVGGFSGVGEGGRC